MFEYARSAITDTARAYLTSALWTNELDAVHTTDDFDTASVSSALATVNNFLEANGADVWDMIADGFTFEQVGHDLWLTRNGHGAGFWDRSPDAPYMRLTDAAHALGESECYVGDDGKVYLT